MMCALASLGIEPSAELTSVMSRRAVVVCEEFKQQGSDLDVGFG